MLAFSFAGSIFIAAICDLEREKGGNSSVALDNLIRDAYSGRAAEQRRWLHPVHQLNKDTTSADLCNNTDDLNNGALFIIIGGILGVVGQVIMLVSWQVVSSVAWRHMKDLSYDKRKGGRQEDVDDIELSRMRLQGLGWAGARLVDRGPGASSMAFGSQRDCYGDNYAPSANSPGSYMRSSGDSQFPPPRSPARRARRSGKMHRRLKTSECDGSEQDGAQLARWARPRALSVVARAAPPTASCAPFAREGGRVRVAVGVSTARLSPQGNAVLAKPRGRYRAVMSGLPNARWAVG